MHDLQLLIFFKFSDIFLLKTCSFPSVELMHLLFNPLLVLVFYANFSFPFFGRLLHTELIPWQASDLQSHGEDLVGSRVRVWWPIDKA